MRKNKVFDPAFTAAPAVPVDYDEVTYMKLYSQLELPFNKASANPEKATHQRTEARQLPLIDIVTPQPKAFYAYLRMPKEEKPAKQVKKATRIRRTRKNKKEAE